MSKTIKTDTLDMPSFDTSVAVDQLRTFAEKGVEQSKEAYAKMKAGAEEAQKTFETTYETARSLGTDMTLKAISAMRGNADAAFTHLEKLAGAKSLSEVIELQTAFVRKSVESAIEQGKTFQAASTKAAEELSKPTKASMEKAMSELKTA